MIRELAATCFYVGYVRVAPGTFGSLVALAVGLLLELAAGPVWGGAAMLALAAALTLPGARLGTWAERLYGVKDPSPFVLDEFVGCLLSVGPVFVLFPGRDLFLLACLPFFLFRFFDVLKPFPAGRLERVRGGWGIMLDDLAAGCYAAGLSAAAMLVIP